MNTQMLAMLLKGLGFDPAETLGMFNSLGQVVLELKSQLDRIETKLDAILSAIPEQKVEQKEMNDD